MPGDPSGSGSLALPPQAGGSSAAAAALAGLEARPGVPKPDPILVADGVVRRFGGLTAVEVDHLDLVTVDVHDLGDQQPDRVGPAVDRRDPTLTHRHRLLRLPHRNNRSSTTHRRATPALRHRAG